MWEIAAHSRPNAHVAVARGRSVAGLVFGQGEAVRVVLRAHGDRPRRVTSHDATETHRARVGGGEAALGPRDVAAE